MVLQVGTRVAFDEHKGVAIEGHHPSGYGTGRNRPGRAVLGGSDRQAHDRRAYQSVVVADTDLGQQASGDHVVDEGKGSDVCARFLDDDGQVRQRRSATAGPADAHSGGAGLHQSLPGCGVEADRLGRPVGSFQAVQHLLADLPGLLDGARLLTAKAAWAGDRASAGESGVLDVDANDVTDFGALATMALVVAGEAAATSTDRSLHVHGGYGFSEEYDIQLYFRRARALSVLLADPARECRRLADLLLAGPATSSPPGAGSDRNSVPHGGPEPGGDADHLATGATR